MNRTTYLVKLALDDAEELTADHALIELGQKELDGVTAARATITAFDQAQGGWARLDWRGQARVVVLKTVPAPILAYFQVEAAADLPWVKNALELPVKLGMDSQAVNVANLSDEDVWVSECEGFRIDASSVVLVALHKYSSAEVCSLELGDLFANLKSRE